MVSKKESKLTEKIRSITKMGSKIYKQTTYNEAISDFLHFQQWKKAIGKEIQNLKNYKT